MMNIFTAAMLTFFISSAAYADLFDWDPVRFDFDNSGNNRNSVQITTPELFGNTFDIGGDVDTSGNNEFDFEGTFDRQEIEDNGNGGLAFNGVGNENVGSGTGGNNGGADAPQPVPEPGTLALISLGLVGLMAARSKTLT